MMTSYELIWLVFHFFVGLTFVLIFISVIAMGVYDVRQAKERRRLARDRSYRYKSHFRKKPSITILIPAYNEELVVERCLESINRVKYKRLKVVVVSDGSKDRTASIVRKYISAHPSIAIRLVNLRKNRGKGGALNYVLRHYCETDLVMVLDADCTISPDGINKAVEYFKDPKVMGVATNVRVAHRPRLLSYLQKIEYLVGYRHKKYFSLTNSEFIISGQGATYRTSIIKKVRGFDERMLTEDIALSLAVAHLGNKQHRLVYASDVIINTEAPPTLRSLYKQRYRWKMGGMQAIFVYRDMVLSRSNKHSRMLTFLRMPQALIGELSLFFEPVLFALFLWIAVSTQSLGVFFGGWFTMTVYTLAIALTDEHASHKEQAFMSAVIPFMYPFFYILTVINVIALFQCVINWRKIIGRESTKGSWVSPDRIGHQLAV